MCGFVSLCKSKAALGVVKESEMVFHSSLHASYAVATFCFNFLHIILHNKTTSNLNKNTIQIQFARKWSVMHSTAHGQWKTLKQSSLDESIKTTLDKNWALSLNFKINQDQSFGLPWFYFRYIPCKLIWMYCISKLNVKYK